MIRSIREHFDGTDVSDVSTGATIPVSTPGDILREEFLEQLGMSARALAAALQVPANRITAILRGTRSITADTALRLGRYFHTTPEYWMNLQRDFELRIAKRELGARVEREVQPCRP